MNSQNDHSYNLDKVDEPQWISMSNSLVRAAHGITLGEKRIIVSVLAQVDSKRRLKLDEMPSFRLSAVDFAETFGIDTNTAYTQLIQASKKLLKRQIMFHDPAWIRKGKPLVLTRMNWLASVKYHEGQGWIEMVFNPQMLPHVMGLRRNFTSYKLQQTSALRSIYSWKLLELLMRFDGTGWAEYSIEDFCASMEATEKQQENFAKIRTKIIEPAVKELTGKDNWLIEWKPIKAGRKVTALRFVFKRNPQGDLFTSEELDNLGDGLPTEKPMSLE